MEGKDLRKGFLGVWWSELANKNTSYSVTFDFQMKNKKFFHINMPEILHGTYMY